MPSPNLTQAIAATRDALNLPANPSDWTYDERVAYNAALATRIATSPTSYTSQENSTALRVLNTGYSPLDDTSFLSDLSTFGGALADEITDAGDAVGGVGRGLLSAFRISEWLIPLAFLAVAVLLFFALKKKVNA
jgi:hypothetical protein